MKKADVNDKIDAELNKKNNSAFIFCSYCLIKNTNICRTDIPYICDNVSPKLRSLKLCTTVTIKREMRLHKQGF